uniref:Uncharacterized protein n=1 Tax=Cyanoderma ruficeps TaxID=181631 RepID=A0A8C3QZM6_9PASS
MSMRRILSRQPHPHSILRSPLPAPIRHRRPNTSPSNPTTRYRVKQPTRNPIRLRQNPIPPILLNQRYPRICTTIRSPSSSSPIRPKPARRPRKLHPSQPPSNTTTH